MDLYNQLWRELLECYDEREAKAIVRRLLEEVFGLSLTDIVCGNSEGIPKASRRKLARMMERLKRSEPLQYIIGETGFMDRPFKVGPGVLIPRPETEELCRWMLESLDSWTSRPLDVLDLCSGSGCIAVSLALALPQASVSGWELSGDALRIARSNARRLGARVDFVKKDVLELPAVSSPRWDVMVSNPPYVCERERSAMDRNVLDYEPPQALFVPDDDPLLFYRSISNYAQWALRSGGWLFYEFNPLYEDFLWETVAGLGFCNIEFKDDQYGKTRFLCARKE